MLANRRGCSTGAGGIGGIELLLRRETYNTDRDASSVGNGKTGRLCLVERLREITALVLVDVMAFSKGSVLSVGVGVTNASPSVVGRLAKRPLYRVSEMWNMQDDASSYLLFKRSQHW